MKNCKLLRLFILCNCVTLSVQMFGMDDSKVLMIFSGNCKIGKNIGHVDKITQNFTGPIFDNRSSDSGSTKKAKKDGQKTPNPSCWKKMVPKKSGPNKGLMGYIYELKNPTDGQFKLEVNSSLDTTISLKIKNESTATAYLEFFVNKNRPFAFSLMNHFLNIKQQGNVKFSTPDIHTIKYQNLRKTCSNLGVSSFFFITLCIPRKWKEPFFNLISQDSGVVNMFGNLTNSRPTFKANGKNSSYEIKGNSNDGAEFILFNSSSFNKEEMNNNVGEFSYSVTGDVFTELDDGSKLSLGGDPNGKIKTVVTGSASNKSCTHFAENVTDNIDYYLSDSC